MKQLNLKVNGKQYNFLVNDHEMLSSVIREKVGLTGTKVGCEQGSCGACTVLVNNEPVLSCITPALRFDNAEITTIEGIAKDAELHKLQEKFVDKGAIQCGFCTPGMVMTSISLIPTLNKKDGVESMIHQIKDGLSGNLCRCTGYKKIIEAVAEYALESSDLISKKDENKSKTISGAVGVGRPYIEAEKKVKGAADYADDIQMKNALHCKFLRSIYPHAKIENIDTSDALKIAGVHYVVTGKELPVAF